MSTQEIEEIIIHCLKENMELSGEPVPEITGSTKPACDLKGFDSLRTLEVLINIEEKLGYELNPDQVFSGANFEDVTVTSIALAIKKIEGELAA